MAANAGLLPNAIESQFFKSSPQNNEKRRLNESYPDLSGHWLGVCDNNPEDKEVLNITQASDASSITVGNEKVAIDQILTKSNISNMRRGSKTTHLHWSDDGQSLVSTSLSYKKVGNLSIGDFMTTIVKSSFSLINNKLILNAKLFYFVDGNDSGMLPIECIYEKMAP